MILQDQNILFFTRTMGLGGTENVVLQLCEIFQPLVNKIVVCSCGGMNERALENKGIKHYTIPDPEKKNIKNLISITKTVKRIIRDERISVIHTHHRMTALYTQLLCIKRSCVIINTSHTSFYDKKLLTHIAFRDFNLIACGEGVKKSLVGALGFNPDRITVICNGVKKNNEEKKPIKEIENARKQGKHIFAVIGRLSEEKGVAYLIKAIPLLKTQKICCVVVGNGPEEKRLQQLVIELGVEDKVYFLGFRKDVSNVISQSDYLVQPSLQEGLPLVPIEAFAEGKTVIGTEIDGISEIIINNRNGILVPAGNEIELAKAIDYMNSIDRAILEKEARETYERKYSFDVFANGYIDYYKALD